jgi:hypothetical protein
LGLAQIKQEEINFSATHYWSGTPKIVQLAGISLTNGSLASGSMAVGPFNGASVYIAVLHYENKGHSKTDVDPVAARDYEVWTDKDGDKVIWELTDDPKGAPGGTARLIDGTRKGNSGSHALRGVDAGVN